MKHAEQKSIGTLKDKRTIAIAGAVVVALVVIIAIVVAVCSANSSAANKPVATMATKQAKVIADKVPISATTLNRGDEVRIVEERGGYVLVEIVDEEKSNSLVANGTGPARVYVEKAYVRSAAEATPAERTAYVSGTVSVYTTAFLTGDPIATLEQNTQVTILDEFNDIAFVKLEDGTTGYATVHGFVDEPIEEADTSDYSGSYYYYYDYSSSSSGGDTSSSGTSGGWSGGSVDTSTDNSGTDGGDIDLSKVSFSFFGHTIQVGDFDLIPEAYADEAIEEASAVVLTDALPAYIEWYNRNDDINVADLDATDTEEIKAIPEDKREVPADQILVIVNDQWGYISSYFVQLDPEATYASWSGYTDDGVGLYDNPWLGGEALTVCDRNTAITILDDIGICYFAQVGETTGYIAKDKVSDTEYEEPEETTYDGYYYSYSYSYSGSGSGGATVDAGNTGSSSAVIETATSGWTEEVL